ncbi:MFS transporter [Plantactinospora sp. CA-294935]|uniref:MFS transporter n=1 Tax=Plantactinospora sp. CA-294935 TaxID=3240012 RepID=UPI003D93D3A3
MSSTVDTSALTVLRTPQTARVLAASLLGRIPLGAAPLALLVFARETMTLTLAGLLVGAYTAGMAVGQPMLARLADRWRQPPVLWLAVAVSTAGFALVAAPLARPLTVGAAALAGLGAPPFEACLRVLWRDLLPEERIHTAYTLDTATQELIFVVGPVLTLGAVAAFGPAGGLATAALCQAAGTVWFGTAPVVRGWRGVPAVRHWAGPLRSGPLRVILGALVLIGAGVGSVAVAATGYAEASGGRSWAGWLLAAQALGALTGGLLYVRSGTARRYGTLPRAAAALALGYLLLLLTPDPPAMLALMAVSGLALPPLLTITFVGIDGIAPAGTAAEAFAWAATAFSVGSALGAVATGPLLDGTGSATAGFAIAPLTIGLAWLVLALAARRPAATPAGA